jgi:hypothetical protein
MVMEEHMFKIFKSTLQICFGVALALQLGGCFFSDHDRYRHYDHPEHHDDHGPSGIDVRVHG